MTEHSTGTNNLIRGALILVMGAALIVGTWSIYTLLTVRFGAPYQVAYFGAGMFDIGAIYFALLAQSYATTEDSGLAPRLAMLAMVSASSWTNWTHAHMEGWGIVGGILLGSAPIIAEVAFEMWHRFEHRSALRRQGRVSKALPVIPGLAWLFFPRRSFSTTRSHVGARLDAIRDDAPRHATSDDAHHDAQRVTPHQVAAASSGGDAQHIVITLQQPRAITAAPADAHRLAANDAPGEVARQRGDAPPRIITVPQHATADAGASDAPVSLGDMDFASLSKAAAIKAMRDALPGATAQQIADALAPHGITADAAYVRTVLSRAAKTLPQGTGGYL